MSMVGFFALAGVLSGASGPVDVDYRLNLLGSEMCAREVRLRMAKHVQACEPFPHALVADKDYRDEANRMVLQTYWMNHGFPTISRVGRDGAHAAFVIAYYSDHMRDFQSAYLTGLQSAVRQGEANMRDYMYMYDRVRVAHGRKQVFGTALLLKDRCKLVQAPVVCEQDADRHRSKVGWGTMRQWQEYAQGQADMGNWDKVDVWTPGKLFPDNGDMARRWTDAEWDALKLPPVDAD